MSLGYVRLTPHHALDAVQWWYYWRYEDGWAFARGGRCRTLREARHLLQSCHGERERERRDFLKRPTMILKNDGTLQEIEHSYAEAVR